MQINRLFEIVYLLMNRKSMTAKELAAHFEVSVRTILRDVDTLSAAGIPVYTSQGRGGGISILDRFVLNKAVISEEEQNQILFALQSLAATQHVDADGVLGRLQNLFQRTDTSWIAVDFSGWGNSGADKERFDLLKNALIRKQAIAFVYFSSGGETTNRKAYPLRLLFKDKSWYLQAYCLAKESIRTFKFNRMKKIEILPETFNSQAFTLLEVDAPGEPVPYLDVEMRFAPHMAYRVYDDFEEEDIEQNEDGSLTVLAKMSDEDWIYGYLLSFGLSVEVLAPTSVREEMAKMAAEMQKRYSKT